MTATTIDQAADDSAPPPPLPWKRQPGETPAHFKLFVAFLSQGFARNLEDTATAGKKSYDHVRKVARDNRWDERAEAHDLHRLETWADKWVERSMRAFDQDEQLVRALRMKAAEGIAKLNVVGQKAGEIARLGDVALRQSRMLYGDPYKMFAGIDPGDEGGDSDTGGGEEARRFANMPKEERDRALRDLRKVLAGRAHARSGLDDE